MFLNITHIYPGKLCKQLPGFLFLLVSLSFTQAQTQPQLQTPDGKPFAYQDLFKQHDAVVIYMVSPTCPLCKKYGSTLAALEKEFSPRKIHFAYVFPGPDHSSVSVKAFIINNKLKGLALLDKDLSLTKQLRAEITPEVFLLNKKRQILYHGAIDNYAFDVGRTRTITTAFYLKDALNAALTGKPIKPNYVEPIGCFIE
jgi:thiol-disulfide isomerase/thioredoxin